MSTALVCTIRSMGRDLDLSPDTWGELEDSSMLLGDVAALRTKMEEDGYLFLRNFFSRELIYQARLSYLAELNAPAVFAEPLAEGRLLPDASIQGLSHMAVKSNEAVKRVVFGLEIKAFYEAFLGGPIRHFDYIWARTKGRGYGTNPHCDIVYMGRGTNQLYTAWIPYGDISYDIGGLMILEKSQQHTHKIRNYLELDVDTYCENKPDRHGWKFGGALSNNPVSLREKFGGRWLSAEFKMGDFLTFRMDTIHGSMDNQTDLIRLSTDTRYQLASEPVDERWVGENPIAHGPDSKKGFIC